MNKSLDSTIDGKYQYISSTIWSGIFISNDYGKTWNYSSFNKRYGYTHMIYSITSSSDGKNIYVSAYNFVVSSNEILISYDYGETWPIIYN